MSVSYAVITLKAERYELQEEMDMLVETSSRYKKVAVWVRELDKAIEILERKEQSDD